MTHTVTLALILILTLATCAALQYSAPIARGPVNFPKSQKHVRYSIWTDRIVVTYYNHAGRKVTTRTYPSARYYAVLQSARVKGYRVV